MGSKKIQFLVSTYLYYIGDEVAYGYDDISIKMRWSSQG
jgi:hypothetical protein